MEKKQMLLVHFKTFMAFLGLNMLFICLICAVLRTCVCVFIAGGDAGRGDPGYATGLHLPVSRSEQK